MRFSTGWSSWRTCIGCGSSDGCASYTNRCVRVHIQLPRSSTRFVQFAHLNSPSVVAPVDQSPQEHNETWKRNRNNHARLMLACLKMGRLEPPFDKHPKDGRLDMLPPHALLAIKTSSEARKLERAAGTRSDWVTDPGIQGSNLPDGGGSPGLGFKSSSYTAVRGGAPIPGPRDPGRNAKKLEEMLQRASTDDSNGPASRVKDMLEIKGDMRDWLGKGAKGEVAVRELAAQKERTKVSLF